MDRRLTICVPYYQASSCLPALAEQWRRYPADDSVRLMLVDDGSPEALSAEALTGIRAPLTVLRIGEDIPWNQPGAKNLAALMAETRWLLFHDVDHVLDLEVLSNLQAVRLHPDRLYLLAREGRAAPLRNGMLLTRRWFWQLGGFNEEFAGHYGCDDSEFLARAQRARLPFEFLGNVRLRLIASGRVTPLARDTTRNDGLRRQLRGRRPRAYIRFPWRRVL